MVKNPLASAGGLGSIPGLGRSPGEENDNPFQYSSLGNPMVRGGWWATVHRVTKSWIWLSDWAWANHTMWDTITFHFKGNVCIIIKIKELAQSQWMTNEIQRKNKMYCFFFPKDKYKCTYTQSLFGNICNCWANVTWKIQFLKAWNKNNLNTLMSVSHFPLSWFFFCVFLLSYSLFHCICCFCFYLFIDQSFSLTVNSIKNISIYSGLPLLIHSQAQSLHEKIA